MYMYEIHLPKFTKVIDVEPWRWLCSYGWMSQLISVLVIIIVSLWVRFGERQIGSHTI